MSSTINIRLTGQLEVISAIYLSSTSPRGPRGGLLYRCTLKERDNGIAQMYADLPLEVIANLFGATINPEYVSQQPLLSGMAPDAGKAQPRRLNTSPPQLQVNFDFRRR